MDIRLVSIEYNRMLLCLKEPNTERVQKRTRDTGRPRVYAVNVEEEMLIQEILWEHSSSGQLLLINHMGIFYCEQNFAIKWVKI